MSAALGAAGHVRVVTGGVPLPVEIRSQQLRLVDRGVSDWGLRLAPGMYVVSTSLPGGRQIVKAVEIHPATDQTVDFAPELAELASSGRHPLEAATVQAAEQTAVPPDWSLRFLRLRGLEVATPDPSPVVRAVTQSAGELSIRIGVPDRAVCFARIARAPETPFHIALPAGHGVGDSCVLTVDEEFGAVRVGAVPAREPVRQAARYLTAGDERQAALLLGGPATEVLLEDGADPIGSAMAAYLVLRLGDPDEVERWAEHLAAVAWLPDAAIVAGERAVTRGDHVAAAGWLLKAGERGLPVFTDGYSILVSRLRRYQTNQRIRARLPAIQVARIRRLLARLEQWSPFVDFSALTLTVRTAQLVQPAEVIQLPVLDRRGLRAANDDLAQRHPEPASSEWVSREDGLRCVHREAGPDQVEMILEWARSVAEPSAVAVSVTTGEATLEYLVILTPEVSGLWVGDLLIRGAGETVATALRGVRTAASLDAADVEAVRRSVGATARAGRDAWRAVARARPRGDPIRDAIVTALR